MTRFPGVFPIGRVVWLAVASLPSLALSARAALVAHFPLDEGATDPLTNGITSKVGGWTGTLLGTPTWVSNGLAAVPEGTLAALAFNASAPGTDPRVATTFPGITGSAARTVAAWVRGALPQPNFGTIVSWGRNEPGARYTLRVEVTPGATEGRLRLAVSGQTLVGDTLVLDGQWHHVAVATPAGGSVHDSILYVDGVPEASTAVGTAVPLNTQVDPNVAVERVHLGNGGWQPEAYGFNGEIDDVRIYDEALPEAAIRDLASNAGAAPALARPLGDQTFVLGDPAAQVTFAARVTGREPLTYEWEFEGHPIPDQKGPTLIINPATPAQAGEYRVTAVNPFGRTSGSAKLLMGTGPVEPTQQAALANGSATFTVRMPDVAGYQYQWEKAGVDVVGATGPRLVRIHLKPEDAGSYAVRVSLGGLVATSAPVVLQVLLAPSSAYPNTVLQDGPEAYWRLGESNGTTVATDAAGFHDGNYLRFTGVELGAPGAISGDADTAAHFSPVTRNFIERSPAEELNEVRRFSVEAWVKPAAADDFNLVTALTSLPSRGYQLSLLASGEFRFRTGASSSPSTRQFDDLVGGQALVGDWSHVVATFDGTTKRLFVNGEFAGDQAAPVLPSAGLPFRLAAGNGTGANPGDVLNGTLDEVAFYRRELNPLRILTHYIAAGRSRPGVLVYYRTTSGLLLLWADPGAFLESGGDA